jgi:hypothetical protein
MPWTRPDAYQNPPRSCCSELASWVWCFCAVPARAASKSTDERESDMRKILTLGMTLVLAGCATDNASNQWPNRYSKPDGTYQQLNEDGAACQGATGSTGSRVFWGGLGALVDSDSTPRVPGQTHAECMAAKGYTVTPPISAPVQK